VAQTLLRGIWRQAGVEKTETQTLPLFGKTFHHEVIAHAG
jgi:hypothetical protein